MDFVALDFETANPKQAPCSVGLVLVLNNVISEEYYTLINPEQPFNHYSVAIHGITAKDVSESPKFPEVWKAMRHYFQRYPIVAHNAPFDKSVFEKAARRYKLDVLPIVYYDTMGLYRHNNPRAEAIDLSSMCAALNIQAEDHHNALADAKAVARAMIHMVYNEENVIFPAALGDAIYYSTHEKNEDRAELPDMRINGKEPELSATSASMDEVEELSFNGSTFVITGIIPGYDRGALEKQIQARGGMIAGTVSKKVNYVITGLQDVSVVKDADGAKSIKILKAEALRAEGHNIKIIDAKAFLSALRQ